MTDFSDFNILANTPTLQTVGNQQPQQNRSTNVAHVAVKSEIEKIKQFCMNYKYQIGITLVVLVIIIVIFVSYKQNNALFKMINNGYKSIFNSKTPPVIEAATAATAAVATTSESSNKTAAPAVNSSMQSQIQAQSQPVSQVAQVSTQAPVSTPVVSVPVAAPTPAPEPVVEQAPVFDDDMVGTPEVKPPTKEELLEITKKVTMSAMIDRAIKIDDKNDPRNFELSIKRDAT